MAARHHPNGTYHNARAQTLPFDADHFELTVTWAVLMQIPSADIERTVAEISRVTDPDRAIIISEKVHGPAVEKPFVRWVEAYRRLFEPRQLVDVHHRSMEEPHWDDDHKHVLLRFE
jgi:ubiquinone/menaquinone biosynthesis C-methylase UbiE